MDTPKNNFEKIAGMLDNDREKLLNLIQDVYLTKEIDLA